MKIDSKIRIRKGQSCCENDKQHVPIFHIHESVYMAQKEETIELYKENSDISVFSQVCRV